MVESLVGEVPDSVASLLSEKGGGNPLFAEELVRHLLERGVLQVTQGAAPAVETARCFRGPRRTSRPARLEARQPLRPPPGPRLSWPRSWVVRFLGGLLTRLQRDPPALEELARQGILFIRPDTAGGAQEELIFKHALIRDIAYETILPTRRRRLHGAVARALESRDGDPAVLAHHWELAGQVVKARRYYDVAARRAIDTYAHEEAGAKPPAHPDHLSPGPPPNPRRETCSPTRSCDRWGGIRRPTASTGRSCARRAPVATAPASRPRSRGWGHNPAPDRKEPTSPRLLSARPQAGPGSGGTVTTRA